MIPSILVYLGILDLSKSKLASKFPAADLESLLAEAPVVDPKNKKPKATRVEGPVLTTKESYILRASAIDACELIVAQAPLALEMDLPMIDAWLWSVAKDREDYRRLPRFVLVAMSFF